MNAETKMKDGKTRDVNHYVAGREAWTEAWGPIVASRDLWRKMALVCLAVAVLSCLGNLIQLRQSKVVPYVVEVDKLGQMRGVHQASPYKDIPDSVIQGALTSFVANWRTVTADIGLQKEFLQKASYQVAGSASGTLREWFSENNPYERGKQNLVEVRIQGVPLVISGNSWQVEWCEVIRTRNGIKESQTDYSASLQIQFKTPETEAEILNNPAGVYVTSISWTRKFKQGKES